jgi:hypothetical protein
MSFGLRDLVVQMSPKDPEPPACRGKSGCTIDTACAPPTRDIPCATSNCVNLVPDPALLLGALREQLRAALSG